MVARWHVFSPEDGGRLGVHRLQKAKSESCIVFAGTGEIIT